MDGTGMGGGAERIRFNRKLGQNMLTNTHIAAIEAGHAAGRRVLELGTGLGVLTRELCRSASFVVSVERDRRLFEIASERLRFDNLRLINADFFRVGDEELGKPEMMVANVPYNLSSSTIFWLQGHQLPAVLCLQKEFVAHMLAGPGERSYSKLSVVSHLQFDIESLMRVKAGNFVPAPRVDSEIIRLSPKGFRLGAADMRTLNLLMEHKKKKVRNAIIDSSAGLAMDKGQAKELSDFAPHAGDRLFQLDPEEILGIARSINESLDIKD